MKSICLAILLVGVMVLCECKTVEKKKVGFKHFKIDFVQDGSIIPANNHEVKLKRNSFAIVVSFSVADSVFVNASFKSDAYDAALLQTELEKLPGFKGAGIQEELFNKEMVLHMSDDSANYWFYRNESAHRFNEVMIKDGIIACKRQVDYITYEMIDDSKPKVPVSEIKEDTIYFVFIKFEWNEDYSQRIEKKRIVYRVVFQ